MNCAPTERFGTGRGMFVTALFAVLVTTLFAVLVTT